MKKTSSVLLASLLIGTIFTVVFVGSVSAMVDDHNLSGLVWRADGSKPPTTAEFAIWVYHGGTWNRFPNTTAGELPAYTKMDTVKGYSWYSYVLPDEDQGIRWDDGDIYRVQVDGTPWGNFDGNCTSNASGTIGDPFPTPYDPLNPDNQNNTINHLAGGGYNNEQQWDVRTLAPIDLVPVNITINGAPYTGAYSATPDTWLTITFNVTNLGPVGTIDTFNVTVWEALSIAGIPIDIWDDIKNWTGLSVNGSGQPGHEIQLSFMWYVPNVVSDFWINISVDFGPGNFGSNIAEMNELNNFLVLVIRVGPNLEPTNVEIQGNPYTEWDVYYIAPGELVIITTNVTNSGDSPTLGFDISLQNVSISGSQVIGDSNFFIVAAQFVPPNFDPGEFLTQDASWIWLAPDQVGDFYVNITVDHGDQIPESNEVDNLFTIHFVVAPDLWIQNVTVEGELITDITGVQKEPVVVKPGQIVDIIINGTNIGPSGTGYPFVVTFTNCSSSGDPGLNVSFNTSSPQPALPSGGVSDDVLGLWLAPGFSLIYNYYINITIDAQDSVPETDEGNNFFILHIMLESPDLTHNRLTVKVGTTPLEDYLNPYLISFVSPVPVNAPPDSDITITSTVWNVGGADVTEEINVSFYEVNDMGVPISPSSFDWDIVPSLASMGKTPAVGVWHSPLTLGLYYINISIDSNGPYDKNGAIIENNEDNNTFTLIISISNIPYTILIVDQPSYTNPNTGVIYVTSSTILNLSLAPGLGLPPIETYYEIYNVGNDIVVLPRQLYTGTYNFTMTWGEGQFEIRYNSSDSVPAYEDLRTKIIVVDDSPPDTSIVVGTPQHRGAGTDYWNITSNTDINLTAQDRPFGSISGFANAAGIDDVKGSGIFYMIYNKLMGYTPWAEANIVSTVGGLHTAEPFHFDAAWQDGYYTIYYNSTDNLGNPEPTKSIMVYYDNTPPIPVINVGTPRHQHSSLDWFVKSSTLFTLTASESSAPHGSGVDTSSFQFMITNQDTGTTTIGWLSDNTFNISNYYFNFEGDGNYTIDARVSDNLGNRRTTSMEVYVDDTPPVATMTIYYPQYSANLTHILNITYETVIELSANDGPVGSGIDYTQFQYHYYNATFDSGIKYEVSFNLSSTINDGIYTIEYTPYDNLGNYQPFNESVYLDNTPPTTTIQEPKPPIYRANPNHIYNITSASVFDFFATDGEGSGVTQSSRSGYRIYDLDRGQWWTDWEDITALTFAGIPEVIDDGNYRIDFRSEDNLGNLETTNYYSIYLDDTGPLSSITSDSTIEKYTDTWEINETSVFTLNSDDGLGCGVELIYYQFDGSGWRSMLYSDYTGPMTLLEMFPELDFENIPWNHTIELRGRDYLETNGSIVSITVYIEGDLVPPLPPVLRVYVIGDDIYLRWTKSPSPDTHHYLIYRSQTKDSFDFTTPWIDTNKHSDLGVLALRTTWNDTNAVNTASEYYYTIRSVDGRNNTGYTSNIAGKVTMSFEKGYNTFSIPLEPFTDTTAAGFLGNEIFTDLSDTVYRYDADLEKWVGHPKFLPASIDNFNLEFGEGYMLFITEESVDFTFTGALGTSIRYIGGVGGEENFQDSLEVKVKGNEVELTWSSATDTTGYSIYRATKRIGEGSLTDYENSSPLHEVSENVRTWTDTDAAGDEYYYMVVAQDEQGEDASSTYAVGIKRYQFNQSVYTVFSLELEPKEPTDVAWYSRDIFSSDSSTVYYYDEELGVWQGQPRFLPKAFGTDEMGLGKAYIVYTHAENVNYAFVGV